MAELKYDNANLQAMDEFLKQIFKLSNEKGKSLDINDVYSALCKYSLKEADLDNGDFKSIPAAYNYTWEEKFNSNINGKKIYIKKDSKFCWFRSYKMLEIDRYHLDNNRYIKLYIPIDNEHLEKGVTDLFEYIYELGTPHDSKVAEIIRNDNVIVRLLEDDHENALKIINFVNNNEYIKSGLNETNPFLPTINGIGYMYEDGMSYNGEMANLILNYINEKDKEENVSITNFIEWFNINLRNVKTVNARNHDEIERVFLKLINEKDRTVENVNKEKQNSGEDKENIIREGIEYALSINNLKHALFGVIDGNSYHGFSEDFFTATEIQKKLILNTNTIDIKNYVEEDYGQTLDIENERKLWNQLVEYEQILIKRKEEQKQIETAATAMVEQMAQGVDIEGKNEISNVDNKQMGYTMVGILGVLSAAISIAIVVLGVVLTK